MMREKVAIFGQSDKGKPLTFTEINSLEELIDKVGSPIEESLGVHLAIQTLMYKRGVLFHPIEEEGYDIDGYQNGFRLMTKLSHKESIKALALPGVSDQLILSEAKSFLTYFSASLIISEKDLFDFISS